MADHNVDSLNIKITSDSQSATRALQALEKNLRSVGSALSDLGSKSSGLAKFSAGVNQLSNAMKSMKDSGVGTADFTRLVKNLNQLASVDSAGIDMTARSLDKMGQAMSNMSLLASNASNVETFTKSIRAMGSKGVTQAIDNMPRLTDAFRELLLTLNETPEIRGDIIQMTEALAEFVKGAKSYANGSRSISESNRTTIVSMDALNASLEKAGQTIGRVFASIAKAPFKALGLGVKTLATSLGSTVSKLRDYGNRVDKATASTSKFAVAIGTLYVKFWLLIRVLSKFWGAIKKSFDYLETVNYFNSAFQSVADRAVDTMGEAGEDSAQAYFDAFTKSAKSLTAKMTGFTVDNGNLKMMSGANLGLDPNTTLNYQATFAQIASSMGVASDNAVILSNVLTEIGADLASVKNMDFEDVWQNMASGIVGMSRAVDKFGINIRNAAMEEKLLELGINATVKDLSQADKALLRTIMILDASKYAWGDLADTLDTPANQIRMLTANLSKLATMFGSLFLPILKAVLPYINALVIALQRLMAVIAGALHIDLSGMLNGGSGSNEALSDILDESDALDDSLENATDQAKKLKNNLLGIDELNILNDNTDTLNAEDMTPSSLLDMAFLDAVSEYQKAWDEAFAKLENKAQEIADKIVEWAKKVWKPIGEAWDAVGDYVIEKWQYMAGELGKLFKDIARDWARVWESDAVEKTFEHLFKSLGNVFEFVGNLARQFREAWNEGEKGYKILQTIANLIERITAHIETMTKSWADWAGSLNFNPILESILGFLQAIEKQADKILGIFDDFQELFLQPGFKYMLEEFLPGLVDVFTKLVDGINWDNLRSGLSILFKGLETMAEVLGGGILGLLNKLADIIIGFVNGGWIKNFALDFQELANALKNAKDINDVINAVFDFGESRVIDASKLLNSIVNAFNEAFDKIDFKNLGKRLGGVINKIFETIDWKALGKAVSNIAGGFLEIISNALSEIDWFKVGTAIGDFLAGIEWSRIIWNVLKIIGTVITGLLAAWLGTTLKAPLETGIISAIGAVLVGNKISKAITGKGLLANIIGSIIGSSDKLGEENSLFNKIFGTASKAAGAKSEFALANGKVADSVQKSNGLLPMELQYFAQTQSKLSGMLKIFGGVASILGGTALAAVEFGKQWNDGVTLANSALMALGVALAGVGAVLLGAPAAVAAAVAGAVFAIGEGILLIHEHWDDIKDWWNNTVVPGATELFNGLAEKFKGFIDGIGLKWDELKTALSEKWQAIKDGFTTFVAEWGAKITEWASTKWEEITNKIEEVRANIQLKWEEMKENFSAHIENWSAKIEEWASAKWDAITDKLEEVRAFIQEKWTEMHDNFTEHIGIWHERITQWATEKWDEIQNKVAEIRDYIKDRWGEMQQHFAEHINHWRESITEWATSKWDEITNTMDTIKSEIYDRWQLMKADFDEFKDRWREKIVEWASEKWDEILNAMTKLRDDIYEKWGGYIQDFTDFLVEWRAKISEWATEKWDSVIERFNELRSGIKEKWNGIKEDASSFWGEFKNNLGEWAKGAAESVTSAFSGIKDKLSDAWSNIKSGASSAFENVKKTASSTLDNIKSTVSSVTSSISSWGSSSSNSSSLPSYSAYGAQVSSSVNKVSSLSSSLDKLKKKLGFATGGFPEDGLFFANHSELVGKFSNNRTAVANNQQITDGIAQATYQAMVKANAETNSQEVELLQELINAVRAGSKVVIDGREIVNAYDTRKARNGYAF